MTGLETCFDDEIEAEAHTASGPESRPATPGMRDEREASLPETKPASADADKPTEEVMILGQ